MLRPAWLYLQGETKHVAQVLVSSYHEIFYKVEIAQWMSKTTQHKMITANITSRNWNKQKVEDKHFQVGCKLYLKGMAWVFIDLKSYLGLQRGDPGNPATAVLWA